MRILVYGAGVLGGYLAHALLRGGNDVTLLARGAWREAIDQSGLIIRHWAQGKTTMDRIQTIESLSDDDIYDIIFVVMQYTQVPAVLPALTANRSGVVVFVGNNMRAREMQAALTGGPPKRVLFGFQSSAGRREGGRIICIRLGGRMTLGSLGGDASAYPVVREAFRGCKYKLVFSDDMDAWLKCHVAFVVPVACIVYACGGNLKRADKGLIDQAIDASSEGYAALEALGIPIRPAGSEEFVRSQRKKCRRMLRVMAKTPVGRLVASDHAMAAAGEMRALSDAFSRLVAQSGVDSPAWEGMCGYLPGGECNGEEGH